LSAVFILAGLVLLGSVGLFGMQREQIASNREQVEGLGPFRWLSNVRQLYQQPAIWRMGVGIALSLFFASLALLNTSCLAAESNGPTGLLFAEAAAILMLGMVAGCVFCALASRGRVELGLVPWGGLMAVAACTLLATSTADSLAIFGDGRWSPQTRWGLAALGFGATVFYLPLISSLQQQSLSERRGWDFSAIQLLAGVAIPLAFWLDHQADYPRWAGGYSNLPPELRLDSLPEPAETRIRRISDAVDVRVSAGSAQPVEAKLEEFDAGLGGLIPETDRDAAARQLVQADSRRRPGGGEIIEYYRRRFPQADPKAIGTWIRDADASAGSAADSGVDPHGWIGELERAWDRWDRSQLFPPRDRLPMPQLNCLMLNVVPRQERLAGLSRLLWRHMHARRDAGDELILANYTALFPNDPDAARVPKFVRAQVDLRPRISARQQFLLLALGALAVALYAVWRVPQAMARLPLWWGFRCLYRVRVNGLENIPAKGGAVLVINHSTWIDGLIILLMSARRIRMIAWSGNFGNVVMQVLGRFAQVILISGGPKSIQRGLSTGRKALQRGELIGIFPEGGITRTGQVREFRPGIMKILDKMPVPIIPVYIDQIWGSIFSYSGGTSLWKIPRTIRQRITINIGPALWRPDTIHQVRQSVLQVGAEAVSARQPPFVCLAQRFVRACKKRRFRSKVADSTGQELTGGMLLTRGLILRDLLRKKILSPDERCVGVLIPPSVGAVIVNMGLALDRRVAIHLNYTLSERLINACIETAGIRHVLTTRRVMEKFGFNLNAEVCYLDDLKTQVTTGLKIKSILSSYLLPAAWVEARCGVRRVPADELLTVIFTSGSTGVPKGVMLSQQNIATNVEAIDQVICLNAQDTLVGVLPFFHSFGYTVAMWGAMSLNVRGVYHFNPLEAAQVGKLTRLFNGTVFLGTPTFLRTYLRKCAPEDWKSVNTIVVGAEKLPAELAAAFEQQFGVRPVEGYGATELSPLVSVNVPPGRTPKNFQPDAKEGTVGRPVPNVAAKITDLDDPSRELGANQTGMLWVKGPNVMLGYMNRPELTAESIVDGWYCTGDVGFIDDEGFITLTGRMSRFSKIGGEMVPHIQIEESLAAMLDSQEDTQTIAVTAVPDAKKGERLIVLYTQLEKDPATLCRQLRDSGLPNLYIPDPENFIRVEAIPILGSGKLDLKRMKDLALQAVGQANR
jgi:1-acyl-sn-glycerol-3-phosphate acyltransferase